MPIPDLDTPSNEWRIVKADNGGFALYEKGGIGYDSPMLGAFTNANDLLAHMRGMLMPPAAPAVPPMPYQGGD